jgi:hypothetical protein
LFNKNGKKHDLGADYLGTSDVYRKPNPYYTKTNNEESEASDHLKDDYQINNSAAQIPSPAYYDYNSQAYSPSSHSYGSHYGAQNFSYPSTHFYPTMQAMMASPSYKEDNNSKDDFVTKIFKKLDLILMSKAILKLIIFKKIIKFIAIICLILFIPAIKKKFGEYASGQNDGEERHKNVLDAYGKLN